METRVAFLPGFNLGMSVSGIVVADDVYFLFTRCAAADQIEKAYPFLMAVPVHTCPNDVAICSIHRRKERSRAVPFVVMGHRLTAALL